MSILKAKETISATTVSSWPHMKKEDRNITRKSLYKQADMSDNTYKAATAQDIARIIGK